jgi:hypothetical protein
VEQRLRFVNGVAVVGWLAIIRRSSSALGVRRGRAGGAMWTSTRWATTRFRTRSLTPGPTCRGPSGWTAATRGGPFFSIIEAIRAKEREGV